MNTLRHLIIGAGPAALAAAQAIRDVDGSAAITLVTREDAPPYSPVALPYLISRELAAEELFAKGGSLLERMNLRFLRGKEVARLLPAAGQVEFTGGERESYDRLLIATGARPQLPPVGELAPGDFHTFRTFADFARLDEALDGKRTIAIYGAGLVAVEAAEKLCLAGHRVVIIARSTLLRKYFSRSNAAAVEQAFARHGGTVLTGGTLVSALKNDGGIALGFSDGQKLTVDHLIVATGVQANCLEDPALQMAEGGLKVGQCMETGLPNVYAAGDVAAGPSFLDGRQAPCPILPEAVNQGRVAGINMAGGEARYAGWIPCNTLRCFGDTLFSIGMTDPLGDPACQADEKTGDGARLKLTYRDGQLIGAEGLNMTSVHPGVLLYLIRHRVAVGEHRQLLLAKPGQTADWLMLRHRKAATN